MPGLYSHSVFADFQDPIVTTLQPGLRKSITEFSRDASQLSREIRPSREARERLETAVTTARLDGFQAGRAVGWNRGFMHGLVCALAILVIATLALGWLR